MLSDDVKIIGGRPVWITQKDKFIFSKCSDIYNIDIALHFIDIASHLSDYECRNVLPFYQKSKYRPITCVFKYYEYNLTCFFGITYNTMENQFKKMAFFYGKDQNLRKSLNLHQCILFNDEEKLKLYMHGYYDAIKTFSKDLEEFLDIKDKSYSSIIDKDEIN